MKTTKKLLYFIVIISLMITIMACPSPIDPEVTSPLKFEKVIPFKVDFVGLYREPSIDTKKCGDYPWKNVCFEGKGVGQCMGNFTCHFEFCYNMEENTYPGTNMEAYFICPNGDSLFVEYEEEILGDKGDQPSDYILYFKGYYTITGGSGRFEGAKGTGNVEIYQDSQDPYSHHRWDGYLILAEGKN